MERYKVGDLVWAKMKGFSPWPGRVSNPIEDLKKVDSKNSDMCCVFFFGTNNYAWIKRTNINPYLTFKEQFVKSNKSKAFKKAVEAIENYITSYINIPVTVVKESVKKEDTCLSATFPSCVDTENIKTEPMNTLPIKSAEYQDQLLGGNYDNDNSYIIDEMKCMTQNIKEEVAYEITDDSANRYKEEQEIPEIKAEKYKMIDANKYNEKELITLKNDIKVEYNENEDIPDGYNFSENMDTKYSVDIKEFNADCLSDNKMMESESEFGGSMTGLSSDKKDVFSEADSVTKNFDINWSSSGNGNLQVHDDLAISRNENFSDQEFYKTKLLNSHFKREYKPMKMFNVEHSDITVNDKSIIMNTTVDKNVAINYNHNVCEKTYPQENSLKRQMNNVDRKIYNCGECDKMYFEKLRLVNHICNIHLGIKYCCEICDKTFSYIHGLKAHINAFHTGVKDYAYNEHTKQYALVSNVKNRRVHQDNKKYICCECNKIFLDAAVLKNHTTVVHRKNKTFKCHECVKMFSTIVALNRHRKRVLQAKKFQCNLCYKIIYSKQHLKQHINSIHKGIKFECNLCGKKYTTKHVLTQHYNVVHKETTKFCCDLCGKAYATKYVLKRHINFVHYGIRNYECHMCNKRFVNNHYLNLHVNSFHKCIKDYNCNDCGKSFSRYPYLKAHIKAVHMCIKNAACNDCGKEFFNIGELRKHITAVHLGLKNHNCTICDKRFNRLCHLKTHMNTVHLNIKNYECSYCNKKFTQRQNLRQHLKNIHSCNL